MDYQVILSPKAVGDLEAIVRYVALSSPEAARALGQRLLDKTKELSQFPLRGQKVPEFNDPTIRQLVLKPYRIVYRVEEDKKRVSIARFWHTSQENLEV
jgi:plasmid stabilization system protein ParE